MADYAAPWRRPTGRLALINPDGSGRRGLTRKNGLAPNWSPHGTKIAFIRKGKLYVIGQTARACGGWAGGDSPSTPTT